jgi:catechol 2,3-dioxygenase-like lactoylglutathione lyase family enzyme
MKADRIFETILYADDLEAARAFYEGVLGMDLQSSSELFLAFRLPDSVLLVFNPQLSNRPGRTVPAHGATGEGHVAFAATDDQIDGWRAHLAEHGIAIEQEVEWAQGGRSLYVRDPAGNSIEFAAPTLWGGDWKF